MSDIVLSVQKACRILKCFNHEKSKLNLNELCEYTGFPKSTIHRICTTLEKEGFLDHTKDGFSYSLSPTLFELGTVAIKSVDIREIVKKFMVDIVNEVKETVALYIHHGFKRICIEKVESPYDVRQVVALGKPLPLNLGSSGKVILAWMQPEQQRAYFEMLKKEPPEALKKSIDQLKKELEIIRKQGFAQSSGERVPDSKAVSAPIFLNEGVMALTILGPSARINEKKMKEMTDLLVKTTNKINNLHKN